jgi:hypothetical protein
MGNRSSSIPVRRQTQHKTPGKSFIIKYIRMIPVHRSSLPDCPTLSAKANTCYLPIDAECSICCRNLSSRPTRQRSALC